MFIRVGDKLTEKIPVATGIKHSLSPMLFNIIMNGIIKEVKQIGKGYRMGKGEIKIVCYVDGMVIISEDEATYCRDYYTNSNKPRENSACKSP